MQTIYQSFFKLIIKNSNHLLTDLYNLVDICITHFKVYDSIPSGTTLHTSME